MATSRWPRVPRVNAATAVYSAAAASLLVLAVVDAVVVRNNLALPASQLFAAGLPWAVWRDWAMAQIPLVLLPAVAAVAIHLTTGGPDGSRPVTRVLLSGALVWLAGAVVTEWSSWPTFEGGWFVYAPNAGVVFSPGGDTGGELIGMLLMGAGLAATAATIAWVLIRRRVARSS